MTHFPNHLTLTKLVIIKPNLGGGRSLCEHPNFISHSKEEMIGTTELLV